MKSLITIPFFLLLFHLSFAQHAPQRPRIGLALSGGGAKGLAHIGILKALDSAGLKIDYITGTSMGAVIGALYAIGYSAGDIEKLARKIDWDVMLSNQSSLRGFVMEEKDEYGRYAVELPWVNHKFRIPAGVLEGEELWLKFAELFYPVYNVKDFNQFNIPFKCISADIATAEAVASDSGDIVTAIRSSIAIPTLFTPVEINGRMLIDGGVVRNFPVKDVKEMGADIVIGSHTASGLQPKEKVSNALQVLMQIAFFNEVAGNKNEEALCDVYLKMPLDNYSMASFNRAEEILQIGIEEGRKLYPQLKQLSDSLNRIYGEAPRPVSGLPTVDSIKISSIEIRGLEKTTFGFFDHMMGFEKGKYYTSEKLSKMIRRVFGTRYYSRIKYELQPLPDGSVTVVFDVVENPISFAKLGVHYNNYTGISLIGNLTTRNFFLPHSRSLITLNVGQNFRARTEHLQYLGRGKKIALILGMQYDHLDVNTYDMFRKDGVYGAQLFKADGKFEYSANRKFTVGAGTRYEWIRYSPSIQSVFEISGKNNFITSYAFFAVNTLNKSVYPNRGIKIEGELGAIYDQHPGLMFYSSGRPITNTDSIGISYDDYQRAILNSEAYLPLSSRWTFSSSFQGGLNFSYRQSILNDFSVGGLSKLFRNQVLFAGLEENTINTSSVAALQFGLRYELYNNLYAIARANGLVNNFISINNILQKPNFLSGYALTLGYNFALGPFEISAMFCDQSKKMRSYINLGISF
ncbi:MAG: patatin-like phospholipase family protein [Chitinophagaceae bacterium]|nr:patatin-like phospholipase family protein [Chitinophagaceae bacterium]